MSDARIERVDAGRFRVSGSMVFATVRHLLDASATAFASEAPREIDLSNVTAGDSAGLALLIEWMGMAHRKGGNLRFAGMPTQLIALAKISDLDRVLNVKAA